MKKLKSNRLSHLARGEEFPTPAQKKIYAAAEAAPAQAGSSTPGPWQADKWATGWTVSAPDSHYSVCHLEDCNNDEANARLIASAPALLVALRVVEKYYLPTPVMIQVRNALAAAGVTL